MAMYLFKLINVYEFSAPASGIQTQTASSAGQHSTRRGTCIILFRINSVENSLLNGTFQTDNRTRMGRINEYGAYK